MAQNIGVSVCSWFIIVMLSAGLASAQEQSECYGAGSIATSVVVTLVVTVVLLALLLFLWKRYWISRKGNHLILETDPEQGKEEYAFDNPGFKDATPMGKAMDKSGKSDPMKTKWSQWSPLGALVSTKNEKKRTLDDTAIQESELKVVSLRSQDFTGLGFNIYGNMREGIFIKDILHHGPASESGRLNSGDRISSVTISFEHMVYEDALTILSYASPYEVKVEARGGKHLNHIGQGQGARPGHPVYRSSSSADLLKIGKSARQRLFDQDNIIDSMGSNHSSTKTRSNATTLERTSSKSPRLGNNVSKPERNKKAPGKTQNLSPEQLKTQLEHNLSQKITMEALQKREVVEKPVKVETETQKVDANRFQKFGVRVLPMEMKMEAPKEVNKSPKTAELSQNENNINFEKIVNDVANKVPVMPVMSIDEVDKSTEKTENAEKMVAPPVKKREKLVKSNEKMNEEEEKEKPSTFVRQNSMNGSGIKRDQDGIPQEIPDHMHNAAMAARKNRKSVEIVEKADKEEPEVIKSSKKQKGKAPPPPAEERMKEEMSEKSTETPAASMKTIVANQDEIIIVESNETKTSMTDTQEDRIIKLNQSDDSMAEKIEDTKIELVKDYGSDSDMETDNQSSVNTIELNSSDITIHHTEESGEISNRKTASTGDLSKIEKGRKVSTGTLERAQSLDITDAGMPAIPKKRKAVTNMDEDQDDKMSSDDSFYGKPAVNKEPRLSLAMDGLSTFQRNRLKKATEWGNLEDAIMNMDKDVSMITNDGSMMEEDGNKMKKFNFGVTASNFSEVVAKIDDEIDKAQNELNNINNELIIDDINKKTVSVSETPTSISITTSTSVTSWPTFEIPKNAEAEIKMENKTTVNLMAEKNPMEKSPEMEERVPVTEPLIIATKAHKHPHICTKEEMHHHHQQHQHASHAHEQEVPANQAQVEETHAVHKSQVYSTNTSIKPQTPPSSNKVTQASSSTATATTVDNMNYNPISASQDLIFAEKTAYNNDCDSLLYNIVNKLEDDTNISDDIKVSRHSLGSLERQKTDDALMKVTTSTTAIPAPKTMSNNFITSDSGGISSITISDVMSVKPNENGIHLNKNVFEIQQTSFEVNMTPDKSRMTDRPDLSTMSELYTTAMDETITENGESYTKKPYEPIIVTTPDIIKNITLTEAINDVNSKVMIEGPSSLTLEIPDATLENQPMKSLTYITEIQVTTPSNGIHNSMNVSEIEISPNLSVNSNNSVDSNINKHEEEEEVVLKKLPEMKFTTSSYESSRIPEKRLSQIELLRSNFEKSPPKSSNKSETSPAKSRIPIATSKIELKGSPDRREVKSPELDSGDDREIVDIMSSSVHSTPMASNQRYQPKSPGTKTTTRNVTVTSIRSNSKIPSGLANYPIRPPVPRKPDSSEDGEIRISTNGTSNESFKQWVFNPTDSSVTNISVEAHEHK